MTTHGSEHHEDIRHNFDAQLEAIRSGIVQLGFMVLENTQRAIEALQEHRVDLVEAVRETDAEIDRRYHRLDLLAFETLARQQPVATDLRLLIASTRMLYEIERSGDLAVNIAKAVARSDGFGMTPRLEAALTRLSTAAGDLFAKGMDSLADLDATAGTRLDQEDDLVDDLCSDFYTILAEESAVIGLTGSIELSRIGRYLERIADHAVNVAENVTYIVTGEYPHNEQPELDGLG